MYQADPGAVGASRPPSGLVPPLPLPPAAGTGVEAAQERAGKNLRELPLPGLNDTWTELVTYLQHPSLQKHDGEGMVPQLAMCSVEAAMFRAAARGFKPNVGLDVAEVEAAGQGGGPVPGRCELHPPALVLLYMINKGRNGCGTPVQLYHNDLPVLLQCCMHSCTLPPCLPECAWSCTAARCLWPSPHTV